MVRTPNYSQERAARARKKQARREQKAEMKAARSARPEKSDESPAPLADQTADEPKS